MGFPVKFGVSFHTLLNFGHCKKLYTSFCKTKKNYFFVTAAENSPVFAQEVESIYLLGNYLLTRYIHYYLDM